MKNWKNLSFETKAKLFDRLFSSIVDEIPLEELPDIQNHAGVEDSRRKQRKLMKQRKRMI